MKRIKPQAWIILAGIGALFIGWGIHQMFVIPTYTDHWDWLTADPEVLEYIKFWHRNNGIWTTANGSFIMLVAATAFRKRERWALWVLAYIPIHIILLTSQFYWLSFITLPIVALAVWAIWKNRKAFQSLTGPTGRFGWAILLGIGMAIVVYAFDNIIAIPALDVYDPDRGWAWLTTDPKIITYIKFYFRVFGIRVLAMGVLTGVTAATGLRMGSRYAWSVLFIIPLLISVHLIVWPWLAPLLLSLIAFTVIGLWLSHPKKQPIPIE